MAMGAFCRVFVRLLLSMQRMRQLSREFEGLWHAELCSNFTMELGATLS
jgi:hypothetical protein